MERERIESIIESLLFVAGEPVPLKRMCEVIGEAKKAEVLAALDELMRRMDSPERGLRVVEVAGGYQFQTAPDNALWAGRLLQSRPMRLSRASLETLAIVAYRQPVTRAEVDEIRGVDSGGVLKTLLEYGFIRIAGRKDVPGRPLIYATDKRFMEFFRLKSLAELPTLRELSEIQEDRIAEAEQQGILPLEDPSGPDEELKDPERVDGPDHGPDPGRERGDDQESDDEQKFPDESPEPGPEEDE
ncbi:MAG TPA: SMC-Scp complex subunit ScpB [bacterium]|nr:SMC-Scp complex subunit ScpB [bacterium]